MMEFPKVLQAVPGEGFTVYAYLNDGAVRLIDMTPMLGKGGVFEPLKDKTFFDERLTVIGDTVAWDVAGNRDPSACIDLDPFVIMDMPIVADPLNIAN